MVHDVFSAIYKGGYKIEVEFDDGKGGIVDFSSYLEKGNVYKKFKDLVFFRRFKINPELGVLTWPDEIDITPETLYSEATGTPLPIWMESQEKPLVKRSARRQADSRF
jgi:hypothetical protein